MNQETFREYCLSLPAVEEGLPFGPTTLVFKVYNKMFALMPLDEDDFSCNLKCDPERALELRAEYDFIIPGFHMNKVHWNTIKTNHNQHNDLIIQLIDHSYQLVLKSIPLNKRILI